MKVIRFFLGLALAVCGMIQLYLMYMHSSPVIVTSEYFFVFIGFLMGIVRYKIFDNSKEDRNKVTLLMIFLLIVNFIMLGVYFTFPITDLESVLAAGGIFLTVMTFEESTWFLLYNFGLKLEVELSAS